MLAKPPSYSQTPSQLITEGKIETISRGERRVVAKVLRVPERPASSADLVDILARINVDDLKEMS